MTTETDRSTMAQLREQRESRNRNTLIAAAGLLLLIVGQFTFALIQYIRLESRVAAIDEWRRAQLALAVAQQEQYIKGLMAIQGLSAAMEALTKQVGLLSEQQEQFRRDLIQERVK